MGQEIRPASFPKIKNLELILANTEYAFKLDNNVRRFTIRARQSVPFQLSFQEGESGTHYLDIFSSEVWTEDAVYDGTTLYLQSPNAGTVIEILQWLER